ncbi:MAG: glycosyl hydrolase, partial [Verrucomicrobiota bacterium]
AGYQSLIDVYIEAKSGMNSGRLMPNPAPAPDSAPNGLAVKRDEIIDLTSRLQANGQLDWDAPAGRWTILRIGHTSCGKDNHPAAEGGLGLECDKLSSAALDAHWAGYVQKVLDDLGPLVGKDKTFNNVLIDSYEIGGQNWTPKFREEFQQRRGYDPLPYLVTLTGRVVDNPEITERFLWDMRRTIADLFAEKYYAHFQKLCHERGLTASIEPYTGPFESLQCGAGADIPMGEFWVGNFYDSISTTKLAASVGHIYDRTIIGAESFTAAPSDRHGRWLDDPYALKAIGDLVYCHGVNRFTLHRFAMQPWTNRWPGMTMGHWGTHFDRTVTWFEQGRAWIQYLTRSQFLLQQGKFVADAAYFYGESAPVEDLENDPALPPGYDYDGINADVLLNQASVKDGRLVLNSGMSYRVLVLPPSQRTISPMLLRKLREFITAGLTVVGAAPTSAPGLSSYPKSDVEVRFLAAEIWGNCDGKAATEHTFGKGKVVCGQPMAQVLAALGTKPDLWRCQRTGQVKKWL